MKRVVPIISQKGGVGKSTCSRGLVDVARSAGITTAAYDADGGVGQLLAHYGERDSNGSLMVKQHAARGVEYFDVRDAFARDAGWMNAFAAALRSTIDKRLSSLSAPLGRRG